MNRKILILSITLLLLMNVFSFSTLGRVINKDNTDSNSADEFLIEDVPYVGQLPGNCFYACLEMVYKYYGLEDIDQTEISVLQGQSYNLVYQPSLEAITKRPIMKPPYKFSFLSTTASNQGNEDIEFLGDLLGFEVENYNTANNGLTPLKSWNDYWERVKDEISNNTPVITCVDFFVWPPFMDVSNIPAIAGLFEKGCHSILIVGYNEKNNTICVHDPYPGELNLPEKGTYQWIPLTIFKRAVRRSYWDVTYSNYDLYIVKKVSEPLSKDNVFNLCHERNIEKLKGNISAYDADYIAPNFEKFGIDAWRSLKQDFEKSFLPLLPFYRILNKINGMPFAYCVLAYDFEATCTKGVADYLNKTVNDLENETLKNICIFESESFYNETIKIQELSNLTKILEEKTYERSLIKAYSESQLVIQDICDKIDEIITIKEKIIAGPQGV